MREASLSFYERCARHACVISISYIVYMGAHLALQVTYDLYGVVNHHGALGAGHYTAYCKSTGTNRCVHLCHLALCVDEGFHLRIGQDCPISCVNVWFVGGY